MPALMLVRPVPGKVTQSYGSNPTDGIEPKQFGTPMERIVWRFGNYQPGGHIGDDLEAKLEDPVVSPVTGIMDYSGPAVLMPNAIADKYMHARGAAAAPSGNIVCLDQGDGLLVTLSHLNSWTNILDGTHVRAGTVVAGAGTTGRSTGVHVHIDVMIQPVSNQPYFYGRVDPLKWFAGNAAFINLDALVPPVVVAPSPPVVEDLIPGIPGLPK